MTHVAGAADSSLRSMAVRALQFVRSLILVLGASVIFLLMVETVVRIWIGASSAVRKATPAPPGNPMSGKPWVRDYNKEFDATRSVQWQPFVYFRRIRPYHGKYVNIDTEGHRVVPQPSSPPTPDARVFFLGGSTMWGSFQRDDHTVPAEASRRLQRLAGPGHRVEVTNFGEQGWVNSQEMIELILQLRAGRHPDAVVFMDGVNEPFATLQAGQAGIPENETKRAAEFAMGRKLDRTLYGHGLGSDIKAIGVLMLAGLEHFESYQRLQALVHKSSPHMLPADSATKAMVNVYVENVKVIEALSRAYDFTPIYIWQPTLHATDKKLTPFEARLQKGIQGNALQRRLADVYRLTPPRLDSAMTPIVGERFIDATHVFRGQAMPIFPDMVGHNAEESIPLLVDSFWPELERVVSARLKGRTLAGATPPRSQTASASVR